MDKDEIKLLCDERPELIADYILATYSGYDLTDEKDCELYFDETKNQSYFDDTKPYSQKTTTTTKEVNNAKQKKEKVYQFKQFDNLLTSSNIFNTLKKFREKKQVSIWKQFNSFDLSTTEQILNNFYFGNNSQFREKIKNIDCSTDEKIKETFNDETSLFFINLDKYINTILINSFIKNIYYELRTDNVLNSSVKSNIWIHLRDYFGLETQTINHRLHLDFFGLYKRVDEQSALIQNFGNYVAKKCRYNSVFKRVYQNTIKAFQNLT